jgi:hypothetical protein
MSDELVTYNKHIVSARGSRIIIQAPPMGAISHDDALNLAAWIVACVGDEERFRRMLTAVQNPAADSTSAREL